ncbi:MAG: ABC transporter ATP-binding protein [Verrucomicrobiota bacterium]|nr:ABC transporter ATP-binding protein [Verrucomicrobiota bacterium]
MHSIKDAVITIEDLSKVYNIWSAPHTRLTGGIAHGLSGSKWFPSWIRAQGAAHYHANCREFFALRPMRFAIQPGEAVGIVGRNGSGKSTLLQIIAGTLQPTTGKVGVHGRVAALLELGSGFNPEFTGRENVFLNGTILGLSRKQVAERFETIAQFADIGDFIDEPVKTYSSGMVMRLAFAVQTAVEPDILIIDEALSVGDEVFQRKCFARLEEIRARGTTILFVSHDAVSVVNLCSRALFLHKGELILDGDPKYVVTRYQRLCHAQPDQCDALLESFRQEAMVTQPTSPTASDDVLQSESGTATNAMVFTADYAPESTHPAKDELEGYDPNLQPSTTVHYDSYGATISEFGIFNERGIQVNQLKPRAFYSFCYTVHFSAACKDVAFAMLIKTLKGQELGGAVTQYKHLPSVEVGMAYRVKFRFQCLLVPWVYYLNAGVECTRGEDRTYAHRIVDAAVFRVVSSGRTQTTALIDFLIEPSAEPACQPATLKS